MALTRNKLIGAALATLAGVLFFSFALSAHAQIIPAQNQVTTGPYGGIVLSTTSSPTGKLNQIVGNAFGNLLYWTGTRWNVIATSSLGISVSPGGLNTQVQYNNNGVFGGVSGATTNGTILSLTNALLGGATLTTSSVNGVTLTAAGAATSFLNAAGAYVVPAGTVYAATYPVTLIGNAFGLAFGTSTSNIWGGTQTFTNNPVLGALTGILYGNNGVLSSTGTTTASCSGATSCSPFTIFGSSPITISSTGTGSGLGTSSPISGSNLLTYSSNGAGSAYGTPTTSATCSGTVSCSPFVIIGGTPITLTGSASATGLGTSSPWTGSGVAYRVSDSAVSTAATGTVSNGTGISVTAGQSVIGSGLTITNTGVTSLAATYPLQTTAATGALTISTAFGTSTSNTWGGTQTFTNPIVDGTLSGTVNANNGTTYATATSTPTVTAPIAYSGTLGSFIGGVSGAFSCAVATGSVAGCLSATDWLSFNNKISSTSLSAVSPLRYVSSTGVFSWLGLATTSQPASSNILVSDGGAGVYGSATSSIAVNASLSSSGTLFAQIGGTASTIGLNLSNPNTWSALQTFANSSTTLASFSYASSTLGVFGTLTIPSLGTAAGTFLAVDPTGNVIATTSPSGSGSGTVGSGTTGQFPYYASNGTTLTATSSIFIAANGNVGVGTSSPEKLFMVEGNQTGGVARIQRDFSPSVGNIVGTYDVVLNELGGLQDQAGPAQTFGAKNAGGAENIYGDISAIRNGADNSGSISLRGYSAGSAVTSNQLTVDGPSGVTAIGTSSPSVNLCTTRLCIFGTAVGGFSVIGGTTNQVRGIFTAANGNQDIEIGSITNHPIDFYTNNIQTATLSAAGLFGIGTGTPHSLLSVSNQPGITTTAANLFEIGSTSAGGTGNTTMLSLQNTGVSTVLNIGSNPGSQTTGINLSGSSQEQIQVGGVSKIAFTTVSQSYNTSPNSGNATTHYMFNGSADSGINASTERNIFSLNFGQQVSHAAGALAIQRDTVIFPPFERFTAGTAAASATIASTSALDIAGVPTTIVNGNITNAYGLFIEGTTSSASTTNAYGLNVSAGTGAVNNYAATFLNGNVGIGTSSPNAGALVLSTSTALSLRITNGSATSIQWTQGVQNDGSFVFSTSTAATPFATSTLPALQLNPNATGISVGSSTPWRTITFAGTGAWSGLTTSASGQAGDLCLSSTNEVINASVACIVSSGRYKQDIHPLGESLSEVLKLTPVSFKYKPDFNGELQNNANYSGEQVGFIAEDVEKIDPRLVVVETGTTTFEGKTYPAGTPHSVRYEQMTALLAGAIQDQQKEIDSLKGGAFKAARSAEENWQWFAIVVLLLWNLVLTIAARRRK